MTELAYYLDDFYDEVLPCGTSLGEWAEWLSQPDTDWPHDIPKDGDTFAASILRFEDDVVATRRAGGEWTFSREPYGEPSLLAVRYGPGAGWSPDNIIYPCTLTALREFLSDEDNGVDDEEYVAVGYDEPSITLVYYAAPPRLIARP